MSFYEIEVFYDGGCPVCRWEVRQYRRMDKANKIKWTEIETLALKDLPEGKTSEDLLGRFHVRDLVGVDAFARIWRVLPKLRYFAGIFSLPGIRQLAMIGYRLFLKWQKWDRSRRNLSGD